VRDIGNASGETFVHVDYDCFGRALETHAHVSVGRFLFTGREWEPQLEVYFYRARYFSPGIGRFLSEDPIGFKGLDPNLYRYVSNVPLIGRDPSGNLTAIELGVLGSGLLGALLGLKSYVVCEITKANQTGISFQVSVGELIGAAAFGFLAGALGGLTVEFVAGLGLYTVPICAGIGFIKKKFG
jgi:RHS repeat-associated protein